jgi:hypothetical protein
MSISPLPATIPSVAVNLRQNAKIEDAYAIVVRILTHVGMGFLFA